MTIDSMSSWFIFDNEWPWQSFHSKRAREKRGKKAEYMRKNMLKLPFCASCHTHVFEPKSGVFGTFHRPPLPSHSAKFHFGVKNGLGDDNKWDSTSSSTKSQIPKDICECEGYSATISIPQVFNYHQKSRDNVGNWANHEKVVRARVRKQFQALSRQDQPHQACWNMHSSRLLNTLCNKTPLTQQINYYLRSSQQFGFCYFLISKLSGMMKHSWSKILYFSFLGRRT